MSNKIPEVEQLEKLKVEFNVLLDAVKEDDSLSDEEKQVKSNKLLLDLQAQVKKIEMKYLQRLESDDKQKEEANFEALLNSINSL